MLRVYVGGSFADLAPPLIANLAAPRHLATARERALAPEWIVTPSAGSRRWLTAQVSRAIGVQGGRFAATDGIVANWRHEFPSRITARILDAHLLATTGRHVDPWSLPSLAFEILALAGTESGRAALTGPGGRPSLERARHYADLFDRYLVWRPDLIQGWIAGAGGGGSDLEALQRDLFLALHARLAARCPSPVERWTPAWDHLDEYVDQLPARDRLSIFGLSVFPGGQRYVDALSRLGDHLQVDVYVVDAVGAGAPSRPTTKDGWTSTALQLWGGLAASNVPVLEALRRQVGTEGWFPVPRPEPPASVLGALQCLLRDDEAPLPRARDASITEHLAPGEMRQTEVLRDAVLHELREDPTLSESDILVVCPDVSRFAPLVRTVLGPRRRGRDGADQPALAYTIVDPTGPSTSLYRRAVAHLLEVLRGRCARSEVLALLDEPAVRRRLQLGDDAAELLAGWTLEADVRWGLNAAHRQRFDVGALGETNTWAAGLRRLHLGVIIENPGLRAAPGGLLPAEVLAAHYGILAQLTSFLDELTETIMASWQQTSLREWLAWFDRLLKAFVLAGPDEQGDVDRLRADLQGLRGAVDDSEATISVEEFLAVLDDAISTSGWIGDLTTGGLTITSPDTLRWIPFRSIYVLGFDEDAFVGQPYDRDDLRRLQARPGDVNPLDDGRGRLAELLLMARERVTILRNGVSVTDGLDVPAGTVRSELSEALGALVNDQGAEPILVTRHRRHGFHEAAFDPEDTTVFGDLRRHGLLAGPWSFSTRERDMGTSAPRQEFASNERLDVSRDAPVAHLALDEVVRFLVNPRRVHAERSLGIALAPPAPDSVDEVDATFEGLVRYQTVQELWRAARGAGGAVDRAGFDALVRSGRIPPEPLSDFDEVARLVERYGELLDAATDGAVLRHRHLAVAVPTSEGLTTFSGALDLWESERGLRLVQVIEATPRLRHLLPLWARAVLVCASLPDPLEVVLIAKSIDKRTRAVSGRYQGLRVDRDAHDPLETLARLAELYRDNLAAPLPWEPDWEPRRVRSGGESAEITDADIEQRDPYRRASRRIFLRDPYWRLTLGHLRAADLNEREGIWSVPATYEALRGLLRYHLDVPALAQSGVWTSLEASRA